MKSFIDFQKVTLTVLANKISNYDIRHIDLSFSINKPLKGSIQFISSKLLSLSSAAISSLEIDKLKVNFFISSYSFRYNVPTDSKLALSYLYTIDISDCLYNLSLQLNNRTFCNKSVKEILSVILKDVKYSAKLASVSFSTINIVQYNESDLSFLMRICTLYNMFIFMKDADYIICDNVDGFIEYSSKLIAYSVLNKEFVAASKGVRVYNLSENYDSKSQYYMRFYLDVLVEQKSNLKKLYEKFSNSFYYDYFIDITISNFDLLVGNLISFDSKEYIVYIHNIVISTAYDAGVKLVLESNIFCKPRSLLCIQNEFVRHSNCIFLGTVISTDSDNNYQIVFNDKYYIAVRLHIDSAKDSYILAELLNVIASKKYGYFFPPRTGSEVVVLALDEFLTRFTIIGSLYGFDKEMYKSKAFSYIRTAELGSPGSDSASALENEILFDDTKDSSKLRISARKDMLIKVKESMSVENKTFSNKTTENYKNEAKNLDQTVSEKVTWKAKNVDIDVTENFNVKTKSFSLTATESIVLKIGSVSISVSNKDIKIEAISQNIIMDAQSVKIGQGNTITVAIPSIDIGVIASFKSGMSTIVGPLSVT